jgi:hypothetical protein
MIINKKIWNPFFVNPIYLTPNRSWHWQRGLNFWKEERRKMYFSFPCKKCCECNIERCSKRESESCCEREKNSSWNMFERKKATKASFLFLWMLTYNYEKIDEKNIRGGLVWKHEIKLLTIKPESTNTHDSWTWMYVLTTSVCLQRPQFLWFRGGCCTYF